MRFAIVILLCSLSAPAFAQWQPKAVAPKNFSPIPVNMSCGIPPIPPIGCKVGQCTCDRSGQNCQWQFVCD